MEDAARAIKEMWTRGAPLLGVTGAYGLCLALRADASDRALRAAYQHLVETRPTAVNLRWALDEIVKAVAALPAEQRAAAAYGRAAQISDEDVACSRSIGKYGLELIRNIAMTKPSQTVNILTHCNAGWLATVDFGTATAPIYMAHDAGLPIHVWVDETRPRNQGALTAFELAQHGVPHTYITDNAGGLLLRQGKVDICFVGADRVTRNGDVANKVGTYLKALAAHDNNIPFYVAAPYTTFDLRITSGDDIPIENRSDDEVHSIYGMGRDGGMTSVKVTGSPVLNPGFDVTPAKHITGYVTDRGVIHDPAEIGRIFS